MKRDLAIRALKHLGTLLCNALPVSEWQLHSERHRRAASITQIEAASIAHTTIKRSCASMGSGHPLSHM